jgi:hypothetical protein
MDFQNSSRRAPPSRSHKEKGREHRTGPWCTPKRQQAPRRPEATTRPSSRTELVGGACALDQMREGLFGSNAGTENTESQAHAVRTRASLVQHAARTHSLYARKHKYGAGKARARTHTHTTRARTRPHARTDSTKLLNLPYTRHPCDARSRRTSVRQCIFFGFSRRASARQVTCAAPMATLRSRALEADDEACREHSPRRSSRGRWRSACVATMSQSQGKLARSHSGETRRWRVP